MSSFYRQQLEDWLKTLDIKADRVVDIGGQQLPVKNRTKSWEANAYKILDLPDFDIEKQDGGLGYADLIFCLEVFEYLTEPQKALGNIANILTNHGKAYITFAFVYPHHNELEMDSLRYTEFGIRKLAEKVGLNITNIWYRKDKSGLLQQFYAADGMRMAKEYSHHDVTGFIVEFQK